MGLFGSTKNDARPTHDEYGSDYSRFLRMPAQADDPFPNPANDGQRVMNARARASKAGVTINSGYLNPETGILEDPDRGFGRWMGNHPGLMATAVIGGGLGAGYLMGPAAVTAPTTAAAAPGTVGGFSIAPPTVAYGGTAAIPTAAATGGGMGGLTVADLIFGGADWAGKLFGAHNQNKANEMNNAYQQQALDFLKQQYADQTKQEQARYDATEARRVPYRAASQDTLAEFRKLLGI